ncbi:MAG: bifunctional DNA-formamidopyrimidine glycosylase/DNA-(apurinic or apyrimidinic site) lyase [Chloroflexi bacterium]|nr:bifunctional DNA-formamidopyrimidine glycosylase/DNA-(apurinic or apyrimidinic site) lyase [Chloroflexota bacterium]
MPELPEVETIKNDLAPFLPGKTFTEVRVEDPTAVEEPSVPLFKAGLVGRTISGLGRRGKFFIVRLDSGQALIVHLRMTGNLVLEPSRPLPKQLAKARLRISFRFDDGSGLGFIDRRRLGRVWLVDNEQEVVGKLGPEPLGEGFTRALLASLLSKRRVPIKAVLCDQHIMAGIGNMYADEALYEARIHPLTPANKLPPRAVGRLYQAIRDVLSEAIANKGASVDTYFRPDCRRGEAHYRFKVAHRGGGECGCGGKVQRIVVRGRGTYYCPRCQRLGR